jgi:hypothetical protein
MGAVVLVAEELGAGRRRISPYSSGFFVFKKGGIVPLLKSLPFGVIILVRGKRLISKFENFTNFCQDFGFRHSKSYDQ